MNRCIFRLLTIVATGLVIATLVSHRVTAQSASTEQVLYSFCAQGGSNCTDGQSPRAGLIMDAAGNLYGTTQEGGAHQGGTVFELTPNAAKTAWTEQVLYSFCAQGGGNCTDGASPVAGLIMDAAGNLYGTTSVGGVYSPNGGTVFQLIPNAAKTAWTEQVLYSFCAQGGAYCTDGQSPRAGLIMDAAGNLYGTTQEGGGALNRGVSYLEGGTVFELIPNAAKTAWTEQVLYSFCAEGYPTCADGLNPIAGLIMDASGNLYGTTVYGGAYYHIGGADLGGTVFELTPNAAKTAWTQKVLYTFCAQGGSTDTIPNCTDGADPFAGLTMDAAGNLYGTTQAGGAYGSYGTVFELTPTNTAWTEQVLHSFGAQADDGYGPLAGLIMDAAGNLYGTTQAGGGAYAAGTAFKLTPPATGTTAWTEQVLLCWGSPVASQCIGRGPSDGSEPFAGLIADAAGNLYGTNALGGGYSPNGGTVFEITSSGFMIPVLLPPSEVTTRASGLAYSRVSHTFNGTVTITNISSSPISGPFQILLTGLTAGATLANAAGNYSGSPYLTAPAVSSLAPGQSATVDVEFDDPSLGSINFTPMVYSGSL